MKTLILTEEQYRGVLNELSKEEKDRRKFEDFKKWFSRDEKLYRFFERQRPEAFKEMYDMFLVLSRSKHAEKLDIPKDFKDYDKKEVTYEDSDEEMTPQLIFHSEMATHKQLYQKIAMIKRIKKSKPGEDYVKIHDDGKLLIVSPITWEGSCKHGMGSKWCTSMMDNRTYFDKHMANGVLFRFIHKEWFQHCPPFDTKKSKDELSKSLSWPCMHSMVSLYIEFSSEEEKWVDRIDNPMYITGQNYRTFKQQLPEDVMEKVYKHYKEEKDTNINYFTL
jgi:hypothetical protein